MEAGSRLVVKSTDGLRVALAGLPDKLGVVIEDDLELDADTVQQLREVERLPCAVEVAIPYRLVDESIITISRYGTGGER